MIEAVVTTSTVVIVSLMDVTLVVMTEVTKAISMDDKRTIATDVLMLIVIVAPITVAVVMRLPFLLKHVQSVVSQRPYSFDYQVILLIDLLKNDY